jgi:ribose-phosphate pyrophosphokinase
MILVNDKQVEFTKFPDGTTSFRYNPFGSMTRIFNITWKYDGDEECILLWYLVNHIRDHDRDVRLRLLLPYIPNARMDRVKNADEVFTLKWFAQFINMLDFDDVLVDDPHSNVSAALLDRVKVYDAQPHIQKALDKLDDKNVLLCYPDEGAAKRYSSQAGREYVFCIKHRDWRTGKIERLELTSPEKVTDRNVLIVDDICSRGGTFTFTLKEAGANEVYLYVTHCENTIHSGTVLTDGLIRHVFTTDSIYRGHSEKISLI